ncbi:hypothetical protein ES703_71404 [subsurface metagenome]
MDADSRQGILSTIVAVERWSKGIDEENIVVLFESCLH